MIAGSAAYLSSIACGTIIARDAPTDTADAQVEASSPASCVYARPPPRPTNGESGTTDFFVAVKTLDIATTATSDQVGYDLDGVCTGPDGGGESCVPPVPGELHVDGVGGRDVASKLFGELIAGYYNSTPQGDINARIANGAFSLLVEVRHYNGAADQKELSVGIYDSNGVWVLASDGGAIRSSPSWDGGDLWTVDCATSRATCQAPNGGLTAGTSLTSGFFDENAYVANNMLVAHFPVIVVDGGLTRFTVTNATLVATIKPAPGGYALDGQLTGVMTTRDAMLSASKLDSPNPGGFLCGDDPTFRQTLRKNICQTADIAASDVILGSDNGPRNPSAPCDALSLAWPFTAFPAGISARLDRPPFEPGCDGSVDDCTAD
jgi:hypothetical protein